MFCSFIFLAAALCGCAKNLAKNPAPISGQDPKLFAVLTDAKASWTEKRAFFMAVTLGSDTWHKRWWIDKTARLLRGGDGIGPRDDMAALMKLSEEEIVRRFVTDERFGETLLDFNMYFLGFKQSAIRNQDPLYKSKYAAAAFELPNAVASAQEGLKGGDYFKLFDLLGPLYVAPLPSVLPMQSELPPDELRRKNVATVQDFLQKEIDYARQADANPVRICDDLKDGQQNFLNVIFMSGYPILLAFETLFDPNWYTPLEIACGTMPLPKTEDFVKMMENIRDRNAGFFGELARFEPAAYNPQRIADFRPMNLKAATLAELQLAVSFEQTQALQNSSTNYNRKRAAYVLKHYFCDDLNPVGVETSPNAHTGGAHGSDTSCAACHYKLDPMAGFFRDYGFFFSDYGRQKQITLDDQVTIDREKYDESWRAPEHSARAWNIGYIRSDSTPDGNEYGESIADLSRIVRRAPEAKRCLVKRLFEYFVAENQTVDAGYLRRLADRLERDAATSSSAQAVTNTITQLVMSHAYNEGNLDPAKCYDLPDDGATNGTATNGPPCRVAFLFQSYCKDCHHDAGNQKYGGLDLTKWTATADGSMSFPHEDGAGQRFDRRATFTKIVDRLSTSDSQRRMPFLQTIPSQDRQEMYLWAQSVLTGATK